MKKVCISFSRYTDADFREKGVHISQSLTGNLSLTNLVPSLVDLDAAIAKFSADLVAAATRDQVFIAVKNKSRNGLDAILKQMGLSVMAQANGDVAILTSSGFTLTKNREPRHINNPGNVTLSNGITSGTMVSSVKAVEGGRSYVHELSEIFPDDNTIWVINPSSTSSFVFTNLKPGKQYWVRVGVIGARGQIAYSTIAVRHAQ